MTTIKIMLLTKDVENPKPDRRSSHWLRKPVIEAGTRWALRSSANQFGVTYELCEISWRCDTYTWMNDEPDDLVAEMLANFVEVEPRTAREMMMVLDLNPERALWILNEMVQLGLVTFDDFKAVATAKRDQYGRPF